MNYCVIAAAVPELTPRRCTTSPAGATQHARANLLGTMGWTAGSVVIAGLVGGRVYPDAAQAASAKSGNQFGGETRMVAVDLSAGQLYAFVGGKLWGAAMQGSVNAKLTYCFPQPAEVYQQLQWQQAQQQPRRTLPAPAAAPQVPPPPYAGPAGPQPPVYPPPGHAPSRVRTVTDMVQFAAGRRSPGNSPCSAENGTRGTAGVVPRVADRSRRARAGAARRHVVHSGCRRRARRARGHPQGRRRGRLGGRDQFGDPKRLQLHKDPRAALTFFWPGRGRAVRVSGPVSPAAPEVSAADFLARPPASRVEAFIGHQSQVLHDPADLEAGSRKRSAGSRRTRT